MVTVVAFLARLVTSAIELVFVFADVALRDPLAFVSFVVGALLTVFAVGVIAFLALGALGRELGIVTPAPGRPPRREWE